MRLLNVGCGGARPQDEHWWNLDELRKHLKPGTPERINLDAEPRYVDYDLMDVGHLPWESSIFDGLLISHCLEHFSCHDAANILGACFRVLKLGGLIVASVPDVEYFMLVRTEDSRENAQALFGEPISPDEPWHRTFRDYALFHPSHVQLLSGSGLKALFTRAFFSQIETSGGEELFRYDVYRHRQHPAWPLIEPHLNRRRFSVFCAATK